MKFNLYAVTAFLFLTLAARTQTTAFTYQGQLISNSVPVTGAFDFRFKVYNASSVVVGKWLTNAPVGVTNGLFTVPLDFGTGIFDGSTRTLEIGVRTNGDPGPYIVLAPRQTLTSVPYAIQSLNALNASNAVALTTPLPATNMTGVIPNALLSPNVAVLTNIVVFSTNVTAAYFFGNGAGLTSLNGSSISSGTLPDARLSTNVAFYNSNANFLTVTAAVFTGSGRWLTNVPGAFFWVTNAATSTPLLPNMGYIATNDITAVVFTLPALPIAGDVYKVAGLGAGGWKIMQNGNQTIAAGKLSSCIGESWTPRDSSRAWTAVASSADGTKLVAVVKGGLIYTSTNYASTNAGVKWTSQSGSSSLSWSSVASSADGTRLVAGVGDIFGTTGNIYTSVDSGMSWSPRDSPRQWLSVASSADGTKLAAVVYGTANTSPGIYTSTDSGGNWGQKANVYYCSAVASSADGTNLVLAVSSGLNQGIWTSTNSGANWQQRTNSGYWTAVASSADGKRLVAANNNSSSGQVYVSADAGATWVTSSPSLAWAAVASSADGSQLVAVAGGSGGAIYTSSDSGGTWVQRGGAPGANWAGVASSADGSKLVAVVNSGQIYTSSQGNTTPGVLGYLVGQQHSAIELIFAGNNLFLPLSHEGTIRAY
jgi:hypothetical protein